MIGTKRWATLFGAALLLVYGIRAATGIPAGIAYTEGRRLAAAAEFERALPLLERSAVGQDRSAALWLTAQVRLGLWHVRLAEGEAPEAMRALMQQAHREYTEAISMSPASGWYWAALGDVYHQQERLESFRAGMPLDMLGESPWALVGRPGRIAIGMLRAAVRREPTVYNLQDQLVFVLFDYRLRDEALEMVRRSAATQPIYRLHAFRDLIPFPSGLLDAFAEGARRALDDTPFLDRVMHLLALGRVELMRENYTQAEQDLRAALESPGIPINRAEAHFHLARALDGQGRANEAIEALVVAGEHPVFAADALAARAGIAERMDDLPGALELLREARLLRRRHLAYTLSFARIARRLGEWNKAESALQLAVLVHPRDPRPLKALGFTYVEQGELDRAREVLADLERLEDGAREAQLLRRAVEAFDG